MSDDDKNFWDEYTDDVSKISSKEKNIDDIITSKDKEYVKHRMEDNSGDSSGSDFANMFFNAQEQKKIQYDDLTHGSQDNIDRKTAYRFKSGQMTCEARLDLHGYTQQQSYDKLILFIKKSFDSKKRCVHIITGKGRKEIENSGVLKDMVPIWLNSPELRPYILMFSYAKIRDGGEGALYVLLKKNSFL